MKTDIINFEKLYEIKSNKKVYFSINDYDPETQKLKQGIFLHCGDITIHMAKTLEEFQIVIKKLHELEQDIIDQNYFY